MQEGLEIWRVKKVKIVETIFDNCFVIEPFLREDNRGVMEVLYCRREQTSLFDDFEINEQRV